MSYEIPDHARLAAADFDGTIADTAATPRGGVNVERAYQIAVDGIFGARAVDTFIKNGGTRNRYPDEIIVELTPSMEKNERTVLVNRLVEAKLLILEGQISANWPKPMKGFLEAWRQLTRPVRASPDTAVISAGHTSFILKSFDTWGLKPPDILVTHESLKPYGHLPLSELVKPGPLPMRLALQQWLDILGVEFYPERQVHEAAAHAVYIGDSGEKDGGLAKNFNVPFVHLSPKQAEQAWRAYANLFELGKTAVTHGGYHE